jgi:hypothetical protein
LSVPSGILGSNMHSILEEVAVSEPVLTGDQPVAELSTEQVESELLGLAGHRRRRGVPVPAAVGRVRRPGRVGGSGERVRVAHALARLPNGV